MAALDAKGIIIDLAKKVTESSFTGLAATADIFGTDDEGVSGESWA